MSVPRQGSRHSSFRPSPRQVGVGVRRDRRECRESAGREPSSPPIAGDIRRRPRLPTPLLTPSPPFAGVHAAISGSPSPPFAGDQAAVCGSPRPAVHGRSRRRPRGKPTRRPRLPQIITSDSMPAGPPLTQARRIAADSCPPAAAIPSPVDPGHMSRPGVPCLFCCAHRNILKQSCRSCPWRLVWGRRLLILWPRRPFPCR